MKSFGFTVGMLVREDRFIRNGQVYKMIETDIDGRANRARNEETREGIELLDTREVVQLISTKNLPNGFD